MQPADIRVSLVRKLDVDCEYYERGEVLVGAEGGNGQFTYLWSGSGFAGQTATASSNKTGLFTELIAGNYTVTARDVAGCTKDFPVTVIPKSSRIRFEWDKALPANCTSADGSISVKNITGGHPPYQYRISTQPTVSAASSFGSLTNGTYIITVADSLCAYNQIVDLSIASSLKTMVSISPISCAVPTANLSVDAIAGGNGNYTLSLDGTNFTTNRQFNNLRPNVYALTIQDNPLSCRSVQSVEVKEQNRADLQLISKKDISCFGGNDGVITVSGDNNTGPFQYAVNTSGFQGDGQFAGLTMGAYTLRAKNRFGCVDSIRVTLTQPTELLGTLTKKDNDCFGDQTGRLELTGSGGTTPYQYRIDNQTYQNTGEFGSLKAGNYTVQIKDSKNCLYTKNTELIQPTDVKLTAVYRDTVRCFGESNGALLALARGGTPGYRYSIDSVQYVSDSLFRELKAGVYTVFVQDAKQCLKKTTLSVTQPTVLDLTLTGKADPLCAGEQNGRIEVAASGGNGAYVYSLDNAVRQTTGLFTGLTQAEYALKVTDRKGCADTISRLPLIWPQTLRSEIRTVSPRCSGDANGQIILTVGGGKGPFTARMDNQSYQTTGDFSFANLSAGSYNIQVSDQNGCLLRLPATISAANPLTKIKPGGTVFTDSALVCKGQVVTLDAGNPGQSTQWFFNDKALSQQQVIQAVDPGTYHVEVRNASGCLETASFTLRNSTQALQSDFLIPTQAFVGDTVLALDITKPIPDKIIWTLPADAFQVRTTSSTIALSS